MREFSGPKDENSVYYGFNQRDSRSCLPPSVRTNLWLHAPGKLSEMYCEKGRPAQDNTRLYVPWEDNREDHKSCAQAETTGEDP